MNNITWVMRSGALIKTHHYAHNARYVQLLCVYVRVFVHGFVWEVSYQGSFILGSSSKLRRLQIVE